MEPLILLCNLYADGPRTLRRLHASGIRALAELERADVERLAEVLGASPASARRLQREATLWRAGSGASALAQDLRADAVRVDPTSSAPPAAPIRSSAPEPVSTSRTSSAGSRAPRTIPHAPLPSPSMPRIASVPPRIASVPPRIASVPLDEIAPRAALPSHKIAPPFARSSKGARSNAPAVPKSAPSARGLAPQARELDRRATERATLLHGGMLDGLDAATCQRLVGCGIRTLAQLACAPAARLAEFLGRPPEIVERWRAQAQERLAGPARDAGERVVELTPAPRIAFVRRTIAWSPHAPRTDEKRLRAPSAMRVLADDDAAGPFA